MLSLAEALRELDNLLNLDSFSLKDLESLVNKVSIVDPLAKKGAVTHLYSNVGFIGNIVDLNDVNIRIFDRTPVAQFLNTKEFRNAIKIVFRKNNPNLSREKIDEMIMEYLNQRR